MSALDDQTMRSVTDIVRSAIIRADMTLSAGIETDAYVDLKRTLSEPMPFVTVTRALATASAAWFGRPDGLAVGAKGIGGITLAVGVAVEARWAWFAIRDNEKAYGTMREIDGCDVEGRHVILVDDVGSTGRTLVRATGILKHAGAHVLGAAVVVDRHGGAQDALAREGVAYMSLLTHRDAGLDALVP